MNYAEAMTHCVEGARVAAATMQPGQYIEHTFSRGYVRCWPVDRVEDEPQRTQCDFRASDAEEAAEWHIVDKPKVDSWGKPIDAAFFASLDAERAAVVPQGDSTRRRPIAHTPLATPKPEPAVPWGNVQLVDRDPLAGCGDAVSQPWAAPSPAPVRDAWGRIIG